MYNKYFILGNKIFWISKLYQNCSIGTHRCVYKGFFSVFNMQNDSPSFVLCLSALEVKNTKSCMYYRGYLKVSGPIWENVSQCVFVCNHGFIRKGFLGKIVIRPLHHHYAFPHPLWGITWGFLRVPAWMPYVSSTTDVPQPRAPQL